MLRFCILSLLMEPYTKLREVELGVSLYTVRLWFILGVRVHWNTMGDLLFDYKVRVLPKRGEHPKRLESRKMTFYGLRLLLGDEEVNVPRTLHSELTI